MSRHGINIDEAASALELLAGGMPDAQNAETLKGSLTEAEFGFYDPAQLVGRVTTGNARSIEPVFSAINLLVSSLSTLPMSLLDTGKGRQAVARKNAWHYAVHTEPCPGWTTARFFGAFYMNAILHGNATAVIDRVRREYKLVPWHRVRIEESSSYDEPRYYIGGDGTWVGASDMIHLPAPSMNGKSGDSPVVKCARALGVTMSAEEFAAHFYNRAVGMTGYIKTHETVEWKDEDRKAFIESFRQQFGGPQAAGQTGILPPGSEYIDRKPLHKEAQHVETSLHQTRVVARIFNIPPHKLGDDAKTSYSSLEQEQMRFVVDGLRPWIVRAEQEFTLKSLSRPVRRSGLKFSINADALLRGDAKTQTDVLVNEVAGGIRTPNEARAKRDLDPVEGGDEVLIPGNNLVPLSQAGQQPTAADASNMAPLFASACDRLVRIERNAIEKHSRRVDEPEDQAVWAEQFYDAHDGRVREAHGHALVWVADHFGLDADDLMDAVAGVTSRGAVVAAARDGSLNELLAGWSDRAERDARRITKAINLLIEARS